MIASNTNKKIDDIYSVILITPRCIQDIDLPLTNGFHTKHFIISIPSLLKMEVGSISLKFTVCQSGTILFSKAAAAVSSRIEI
jgi:hypothetical protein